MSEKIDPTFDQEANRNAWKKQCSGTGRDINPDNPTGATDCIPHTARDKKILSDVKYGRT